MKEWFSPLRSVRGRLLTVAIVVEAIMLTLLVANSLRLLTEHMGRQAQTHVEEIVPVLSAAIVAPLAQRDYATVQAVLDESAAVGGIVYLTVTGNDGKRLASSGWPNSMPLPPPDAQLKIFDDEKQKPRFDIATPSSATDRSSAPCTSASTCRRSAPPTPNCSPRASASRPSKSCSLPA